MSGVIKNFNRNDTLINSASVSIVRYLQRLIYFDNTDGHGEKHPDLVKHKTKTFPHKEFRRHVENVEELLSPAMERYAEELFDFLADEMFQAGHLKKEGNSLVAIPLDEHQRKRWLKRKLDQWKASLL